MAYIATQPNSQGINSVGTPPSKHLQFVFPFLFFFKKNKP
jgi:hypothetical protein